MPERATRATVLEKARATRAGSHPEPSGTAGGAAARETREMRGAGSANRPAPSLQGSAKQRGEQTTVATVATTNPLMIAEPALTATPTSNVALPPAIVVSDRAAK